MAAPRNGTYGCLLICSLTLGASEYATITCLVQPLPSTRFDWQVATLFIAPMAAASALWFGMLTVRIGSDILTLLRYLRRHASTTHHSAVPQARPHDPRVRWMSPGHQHVAGGLLVRRTPDPHAVEKGAP